MMLYPFELKPVLKDIIWGGTRLASEYKKAESGRKIAESWELCVHENGANIIDNGIYTGKGLDYIFNLNKDIVKQGYNGDFPVLIKFIDAEQDLSVQVHPDDAYASKYDGESGKTEIWYIMDCVPGAKLVYGLSSDYTRDELADAIKCGRFEACLNYVDVKPGDIYFIPAGLIHAIGSGILLAEIQQNSDTTYRLYDYNRPGADGKLRELHTEKALDVCVKTKSEYKNAGITDCEYFTTARYNNIRELNIDTRKSFASIICLDGKAEISCGGRKYNIEKGGSYFIPAGLDNIRLTGRLDIILTTLGGLS